MQQFASLSVGPRLQRGPSEAGASSAIYIQSPSKAAACHADRRKRPRTSSRSEIHFFSGNGLKASMRARRVSTSYSPRTMRRLPAGSRLQRRLHASARQGANGVVVPVR
jgi:hypothetical protein